MNNYDVVVILEFARNYLEKEVLARTVAYACRDTENDNLVDALVGEIVRRVGVEGANELLAEYDLTIKWGIRRP